MKINIALHISASERTLILRGQRIYFVISTVTRQAMAEYGYFPSRRRACGATILTDVWEGLETFFTPGGEILPVRDAADVLAALERSYVKLRTIATAGRDEYFGTLINAWIAVVGEAVGVRAGEKYFDVGTLNGYRQALQLLAGKEQEAIGNRTQVDRE